MRFIVDLYRYLVYAFCGLLIIAVVLGTIFAVDMGQSAEVTVAAIFIAIAVMMIMVLNLGLIATMISVHDRHAELVEQTERMANALDRATAHLTLPRGAQ